MKKFTLTLFVTLLMGIQTIFAQDIRVTGTVKDSSGAPIPGVTVVVDGTTRGVSTAVNGSYAISVPANGTLLYSFIGMNNVSIPVNNRTVIDVVLESDNQLIDEIVVTGYGSQRKASFTGAASIIGEDVLAKKTDVNFVKSLEGSVAGLQMSNSTSMPGVWGSVYVRGRGSLSSGTQPLYVIDGMPINSDTEQIATASNNAVDPMAAINSNDIESVTVLKDAAATAIYGSRAANGVIVITTKKGSEGKFNLNVDVKQGIVTMGNHNMDFANAQETMDLFARGYSTRYPNNYTYQQAYDYISRVVKWDGTSSYDWMDAVTRNGSYQEYALSASGRSGQTGYFASFGYTNSEGIIIASDLERMSGRLNLDSKFKFMSFGANMSYSTFTRNGFSQSTGGAMANPQVSAMSSMLPFYPFYNADGSYNTSSASYNPLAVWDKKVGDLDRVKNQTINMNPYLRVDFGMGIYAKTTLGYNVIDQEEYLYWGPYNNQGIDAGGRGRLYTSRNTVLTWNNLLGWDYTFNQKHTIGLMLGQEMQQKDRSYRLIDGRKFPFWMDGMRDLTTAGEWGDSEYYQAKAKLASYFADAHYSYDDKYYLSASFRRDGSSVFGADHRWGNFWSVGGKWRITGEDFLKNNPIITNAALRASYGTVGNQDIGWYSSRGFYAAGYNYNSVPGMVPTSNPNPDLTWEVSKKLNIGIDLSFLNSINLSVDYYNEETSDALYEVPLSMTTGLATTMQNVGTIRNRGVEVSLNATIMQQNDLLWTAYATMTYNQNRVMKLATDESIFPDDFTVIAEGRPYRQFYMREYAGVDRETGKPLYYLNAEGNETTSNFTQAAKRYVGSADPKVVGGFGTNVSWKGIDFSAAFNYRLGGKVFDYGATFTGWGMALRTPLKRVASDSWTPENKDAKYPQYIYNDPNGATSNRSSRFVYSGNFLRISNLTLGYTLPSEWLQKAFIQRLRVYVTADNLYTFTADEFVGYNPETYTSGFIAWQYPATRTFTAGVQITF